MLIENKALRLIPLMALRVSFTAVGVRRTCTSMIQSARVSVRQGGQITAVHSDAAGSKHNHNRGGGDEYDTE